MLNQKYQRTNENCYIHDNRQKKLQRGDTVFTSKVEKGIKIRPMSSIGPGSYEVDTGVAIYNEQQKQ